MCVFLCFSSFFPAFIGFEFKKKTVLVGFFWTKHQSMGFLSVNSIKIFILCIRNDETTSTRVLIKGFPILQNFN